MNALLTSNVLQKRAQRITVYPNLVTQKQFWLQLYNIDKCVFSVHVYSLTGQQVFKLFLYHSDVHSSHTIQLPAHVQRGVYKVAVRTSDSHHVQPIVIE